MGGIWEIACVTNNNNNSSEKGIIFNGNNRVRFDNAKKRRKVMEFSVWFMSVLCAFKCEYVFGSMEDYS